MKTLLVAFIAAALVGCGTKERPPQFPLYGPPMGHDSAAWSSPPFDGDHHAWKLESAKRAQHETEYAQR